MQKYNSAEGRIAGIALRFIFAFCLLARGPAHAEDRKSLWYPEAGITTSLNIPYPSFGYWFGRVGLRVSGIYLSNDRYEFYFNAGYAFHDTREVQHSVNLLTSRFSGSDPGADYRYWATGIAYALNYRGFFLEFGLAYPWKDEIGNLENDPFIPCGYLGYIFRFRPG